MIVDALLKLAEEKSLAAAVTSNVVDFHQENPNLGTLNPPFHLLMVTGGQSGEGTVTFKIQDSADNSSFADVVTFAKVGKDIPSQMAVPMPIKHRRYVRLVTAVTGTVAGTLKVAVFTNVFDIARTAKIEGYEMAKTID